MRRSRVHLALPLLLLSSCGTLARLAAGGAGGPSDTLLRLQEDHRVEAIDARRFTHAALWAALEPLVDASPDLSREEIGRSAEGRPIRAVTFGEGPTRVLLWSQMHGDESTATMALADLVSFLSRSPEHPLAREISAALTVAMVPMLNPDGAERFQRRNAYGIDVNRDARALATPEGRALKGFRDRFDPDFGFNLHDQNVRTRVGESDRTAAIALLAPAFDASRGDDEVRARAKRVAAVVRETVEPLVPGHVAKYDDTFNARAFGDLMQAWGTSTVLIESGGWRDDPEKQYLRAVNFAAILRALSAIADGSYAAADPASYESLPFNGPPVSDLLVLGGTLAIPGLAPLRADVAVNFSDPLLLTEGRITEIGDLGEMDARDTLDVGGLVLHPSPEALRTQAGRPALGPGAPASFVVRRTADASSGVVMVLEEGVVTRR